VPVPVELARQQWGEGYRRIRDETGDPRVRAQLLEQVDVLTRELRRRVGGSYTIRQLADRYADADRWGFEAIEEQAPAPGWARLAAVATDAAFHLYARGARDYRP
jgi:hypothetical protein